MPNIETTSVLHLPAWKKTTLGTPIELFASSSLDVIRQQNPILLMGGVHGDEPEGVRLARDTLTWLKSNTTTSGSRQKAICPWIVIPCLNVDGFARQTRVNGRGVDLNRNYPAKDWSNEARAERYSPGEAPASESEVQAIVELITTTKPRLIIHCHSWKPCIVGAGPASVRDTERLAKASGYEGKEDIGYPTPGSLSSYGWIDHQIPVICIEEDDTLKDYDSIWPRFRDGIMAIFTDLSKREVSR
jgi:protein MpaA